MRHPHTSRLLLPLALALCWSASVPAAACPFQDEDASRPAKKKAETKAAAGLEPKSSAGDRSRPSKTNKDRATSGGRERAREGTGASHVREAGPAPGQLSLTVEPPDSVILLNEVEQQRAGGGVFTRGGLSPGTYRVLVRREGYFEQPHRVDVKAGVVTPLAVRLKPMSAVVSVAPTLPDAEIKIFDADASSLFGSYTGRAGGVELAPGRYQIFISKEGYRTAVRELTVKPAERVYIEPTLETLPEPPPAPVPAPTPRFRPDTLMRAQTSEEGKFIVVSLSGRSGEASSALGSVDVTLSGGRSGPVSVSGMLTGYPCQVDFVRLENVAEFSFKEPPGVSNEWARVVVRVRPKDSKRPIHFLVNWKSLQAGAPPGN